MGKASFFFGDIGQGSKVKLIVNMVMGTMMSSFSEGIALSEKANLPVQEILSVIELSAISNPMFKTKGSNILKSNFDTNFPLKHAQKDMRLALEMAGDLGIKLPTTKAANEEYVKALGKYGDEDFSAIYKVTTK
jgi:3-hydroxyisobutyrate dehydrogenase-like beta-hydroxyacid dehydrogenase